MRQQGSLCPCLDSVIRQQLHQLQVLQRRGSMDLSLASQLDTHQLEDTQLARRGCSQLVAVLDREQRRACVLPGGGQLQRARRRRGGGAQLPAVHVIPCTPQLDPGPRHTSSVSTGDNMHRLNINM